MHSLPMILADCEVHVGAPGEKGQLLVENDQVKKIITSFSIRAGMETEAERRIAAGTFEVELVPQGTLVERCRAGGSGGRRFSARAYSSPWNFYRLSRKNYRSYRHQFIIPVW